MCISLHTHIDIFVRIKKNIYIYVYLHTFTTLQSPVTCFIFLSTLPSEKKMAAVGSDATLCTLWAGGGKAHPPWCWGEVDVLMFCFFTHTPKKNIGKMMMCVFFLGREGKTLFVFLLRSWVLLFFDFSGYCWKFEKKPATIFVFSTALIELDGYTRWVGFKIWGDYSSWWKESAKFCPPWN